MAGCGSGDVGVGVGRYGWFLRRIYCNMDLANMRMTGYQQVTYFKQRRVMEFNKQKTLEKLRNEGVKGVPKDIAPPGIQGKPT